MISWIRKVSPLLLTFSDRLEGGDLLHAVDHEGFEDILLRLHTLDEDAERRGQARAGIRQEAQAGDAVIIALLKSELEALMMASLAGK